MIVCILQKDPKIRKRRSSTKLTKMEKTIKNAKLAKSRIRLFYNERVHKHVLKLVSTPLFDALIICILFSAFFMFKPCKLFDFILLYRP